MIKKTDPNPQLDMFTAPSMQLGSRASKKYSDTNAWSDWIQNISLFKVDSYINFENVIQICKYAPSAGSKNFIGKE